MAVWAIVHHQSKKPIHVNAYTTANTRSEAWKTFKGKWRQHIPGIPSPRILADQIEISYWDIVEIIPPEPPQRQIITHTQTEFNL